MPKALIFGAGANGAGFLARLAADWGHDVVFVEDRAAPFEAVRRGYPIDVVGPAGVETVRFERVAGCFLAGESPDAVAREIVESELVFTAVTKEHLHEIVPLLARGLELFLANGSGVKNIVPVENMHGPDALLRAGLAGRGLEPDGAAGGRVGFTRAMTHVMSTGSDYRGSAIVSDDYAAEDFVAAPLIVDASVWLGPRPVRHVHFTAPFERMEQRKLYVHNLWHLAVGLVGWHKGLTFVHEAAADAESLGLADRATGEACDGLAAAYGAEDPASFGRDALLGLRDRVHRVTANPRRVDFVERLVRGLERKLAKPGYAPSAGVETDDRVTGPALLCLRHGIRPEGIARAAALALQLPAFADALARHGPRETIRRATGLLDDGPEGEFAAMIERGLR